METIQTEYKLGDLIFAKVRGHPHWPARINKLKEGSYIPKGKYPIFFYGTHETFFLRPKDIFPYEKFKDRFGKPHSRRLFNEGLSEMVTNPNVMMPGYDLRDTNYENIEGEKIIPEIKVKRHYKRKLSCADDGEGFSPVKKLKKDVTISSIISRTKNFGNRAKTKFVSYANQFSKRFGLKSQKLGADVAERYFDSGNRTDTINPEILKLEEQYLHQVQVKLTQLELDIKTSLCFEDVAPDEKKCLDLMTELDSLPLSSFLLKKNPDIILTIKKLRRYVGNEMIRFKADYLFSKFKGLFLSPDENEMLSRAVIDMDAFKTDDSMCQKARQFLSNAEDSLCNLSGTALPEEVNNSKEEVDLNLQEELETSQELSLYQENENAPKNPETGRVSPVNKEIQPMECKDDPELEDVDRNQQDKGQTEDTVYTQVVGEKPGEVTRSASLTDVLKVLDSIIYNVVEEISNNTHDNTAKNVASELSKESCGNAIEFPHDSKDDTLKLDNTPSEPPKMESKSLNEENIDGKAEEKFGEADLRASESATMFDDSTAEQRLESSLDVQQLKGNASLMFTDDEQRMDDSIQLESQIATIMSNVVNNSISSAGDVTKE